MSKIKNFFASFKTIFTGEDVLKENEKHANMLTSTIMFNILIVQIIVLILNYINILDTGLLGTQINYVIIYFIGAAILLLITSIICFILKGKGKYLKHVLFMVFIGTLALMSSILTYSIVLAIAVPIVLASRYYSKKFTIFVAIASIFMFGISAYIGTFIGWTDLNNTKIPEGTTITIDTTLEDAVDNLKLDQKQKIKDIMLQSYLPTMIIYIFLIFFPSIRLSETGRKMVEKQKELSEESARIESELNIATEIQKNMLPSTFPAFPQCKEFDIYASMIPAKEVGGDFYDMFLIDENHLAIVIADVSGKGVPAALIMMTAETIIQNTALNSYSADEVFNKVNKLLCKRNKSSHFITSWLGILDLRTGKLEYANAGHNPPLIYSKNKNEFEYLSTTPDLVLAIMDDTQYQKHELILESGDKVFLYTDGVTEAMNEKDELYKKDRLLNYLNSHINDEIEENIKGITDDIKNFAGNAKQSDDITMLELVFKEKKVGDDKAIKEFLVKVEELPTVINFVNNELERFKINSKYIKKLDLVVEELFVNIAQYAYSNLKDAKCKIMIEYDSKTQNIKMTFEDNGIKFNPLEKEDPDFDIPEEMQVGGLGIYLVKNSMDNIEYKYEDNKNILILSKNVK